jgi:hypothetical protein
MPGYHPRTRLTAEDAKDAEENQKRGKNVGGKSRPGAEMTTDTRYLFSDVFLFLPFLRVLRVLCGEGFFNDGLLESASRQEGRTTR